MSEQVAAARPAHGTHKAATPELGEELLQIGQRDLLPLGDVGQRDRTALHMAGKIAQRHHGVATLRTQLHLISPLPAHEQASTCSRAAPTGRPRARRPPRASRCRPGRPRPAPPTRCPGHPPPAPPPPRPPAPPPPTPTTAVYGH